MGDAYLTARKRVPAAFAILTCATLFWIVLSMVRSAEAMARHDRVTSNIHRLAMLIEGFRSDHGVYPSTLDELAKSYDANEKQMLNRIVDNGFHDVYFYTVLTNGFVLSAQQSNSSSEATKIERVFKLGEAFQDEK